MKKKYKAVILTDVYPTCEIVLNLEVKKDLKSESNEPIGGSTTVKYFTTTPHVSKSSVTKISLYIKMDPQYSTKKDIRWIAYHEATHSALSIVKLLEYSFDDIDDGDYCELVPYTINIIAETIINRLEGKEDIVLMPDNYERTYKK